MGTAIKNPVPDWDKPIICNFWHPGTLTLRAERQSARMSKITHDGLARSACHRMLYSCTHTATVGVEVLNVIVSAVCAIKTGSVGCIGDVSPSAVDNAIIQPGSRDLVPSPVQTARRRSFFCCLEDCWRTHPCRLAVVWSRQTSTRLLVQPLLACVFYVEQCWHCRRDYGRGSTDPQFISTDAHFWVKIGFKFQCLYKISITSTSDPSSSFRLLIPTLCRNPC